MKKAGGGWGGEVGADADGASRLTEEEDARRVPAEGGDVGLDPLQGKALVLKAVGTGGVVVVLKLELREGEEAKDVEAVLRSDDDNAVLLRQGCSVVAWGGERGCRSDYSPCLYALPMMNPPPWMKNMTGRDSFSVVLGA